MIIGIDIGTTNTLAVLFTKGIYRIIPHYILVNSIQIIENIFPSVISYSDQQFKFGLEAQDLPDPDQDVVLSLKQKLNYYRKGSTTRIGKKREDLGLIYQKFVQAVVHSIKNSLQLDHPVDKAVFTIPANASSNHRWVLRKAAENSNLAMEIYLLDEPVASILDFYRSHQSSLPQIAVFDLGGGTFDVSLVEKSEQEFKVIASEGIENLGGNSFDQLLIDQICEKAGCSLDSLSSFEFYRLQLEAKRIKESLIHYKNKLPEKLDALLKDMDTEKFNQNVEVDIQPLMINSLKLINKAVKLTQSILPHPETPIYVTGGGTLFPPVRITLQERFNNLIFSPVPLETVAMGAAMYGGEFNTKLSNITARHLGVIRLTNQHQDEYFDVIFPKGTALPDFKKYKYFTKGPYRPYHNIGYLKFFEAGALVSYNGEDRDIRIFNALHFPYDQSLDRKKKFDSVPIKFNNHLGEVEVTEEYRLDHNGIISLEITRQPGDFTMNFEIFS